MKKILKHIKNKTNDYVYDSGICIGSFTKKAIKEDLQYGIIKQVKGYLNVYQTVVN